MNGRDPTGRHQTLSSTALFHLPRQSLLRPPCPKHLQLLRRLIALATLSALFLTAAPAMAEDEAAPSADAPATDKAALEKERARRLEQMAAAAADYQLWRGRDDEQPLVRVERPVLRWSNPVRAAADGAVFLWADEKGERRPAAAMCVYGNGPDGEDHEWQSLCTEPLRAAYRGAVVWRPQAAGLEFHAVPGAPEAAATPARRLTQMRAVLREFSATAGREKGQHELRALTTPIYRYGDEQAEVVDGAVFAFAQATDPEILLLLEARRENAQPAQWRFAAARMSMVPLDLKYRDELVWSVDWHYGNDERQPRVTFLRKRADP
jgi:hypothetical protein